MNRTFYHELNSLSSAQPWLDRLVDGELARDEERQLLLILEGEPDGWRRCALAFLEAGAWRKEFSSPTTELAATPSPRIAIRGLASHSDNARAFRWFTVAASLLLAFILGAMATSWWRGGAKNDAASIIAAQQPTAVNDLQPSAVHTGRKWQALKVSLAGADGQSHSVEVPLIEVSDQSANELLHGAGSPLPAEVQAALERSGHHVSRQRSYYPVALEDGSQAVLPIDLVEVTALQQWQ